MKRILIPISFSKASKNSLKHAAYLFQNYQLTLVHNYPLQDYNRKFDFGKSDYSKGIIDKLNTFHSNIDFKTAKNLSLIANMGDTSEFVEKESGRYDLIVMSRKLHGSKEHGYFSDKKLFITTKSRCPVLIMPITDKQFNFEKSEHIWHIKQNNSESALVDKWSKKWQIDPDRIVNKTTTQSNFISAFWHNLVDYEHSHKKKLLSKIDKTHDSEPIDLIVIVDSDDSIFTRFFKSDIIRIFCKYDIPILVLPTKI